MVRDEVKIFIEHGPLPESATDEKVMKVHEDALAKIKPPVSIDEARSLLTSFGPDDCFGLAWTLLHLIETAPVHPLDVQPTSDTNEWLQILWDRAH